MGKIAFVFPGQGAQYPGMGRDFYEKSETAGKLLDSYEKEEPGLLDMIFNASAEVLMKTANTQRALYAVETAIASAVEERGLKADCTAGFSLGELSALAYAGSLTYTEGFHLVSARAELMQRATEKLDTGMVAVLKLPDEDVRQIASSFEGIYPVNFNAPGQVVVAGTESALPAFEERIKLAGGRTMRLSVSGGFHSPFMKEAADGFRDEVRNFSFRKPVMPVWSNVTGTEYPEDIPGTLSSQIESPVMWAKSVADMITDGVDTFIELGPGTTLSGLIRRTDKSVRTISVGKTEDLEMLMKELG